MAPTAPFRPGWHFKDGKLLRFSKRYVEVLRAWPEPLAWRRTQRSPWRHVRPDLRLEETRYAAAGEDLEALRSGAWVPREVAEEEAGQAPGQLCLPFHVTARARIEAGLQTRQKAAREFLATIPEPVQDAVSAFDERQWHILALLARCPGADELVPSNPALAWAIASNWVFHKPAVTQPMRAARRLVRLRRRDAAGWLGFPPRPSAVRLLAKVPSSAIRLSVLLDLRRVLHDEEATALARHLPVLGRGVLVLLLSEALRPYLTASLLAEIASSGPWSANLRAFGTLRDGLAMAEQLGRPVPARFPSLHHLERFHGGLVAETNLGRDLALLHLEFPPPPVPGTDLIEPLTRPLALLEEGRVMSHCAASYAREVAAGQSYVYRLLEPERATIELRPRGHAWSLAQVRGVANAPVGARAMDVVRTWLGRVGREGGSEWERHADRPRRQAFARDEAPF